MNKKLLAVLITAMAVTACTEKNVTATESSSNQNKKPNVIYILADDLGYGDLGVYGQQRVKTPNLDDMAKNGVMFTDFYAGANVCAPSRATLMTGKHQGHARVRGNKQEYPLRDEDVTVAEVFKQGGYHTGVIGKWGLGDEGSTGTPDKQGFDFFYGYLNHVHAHNHYPEWLWRNGEKEQLTNVVEHIKVKYSNFPAGIAKLDGRHEYAGDLIIKESLDYIDRQAKSDQPFFLYIAPIAPHANGDVTQVDWTSDGMEVPDHGLYKDKAWAEPQKGFAAMVTHLDNGIGQIKSKLEALGIDNNTIIMFSSDNGPHKEGGHIPAYFDSSGSNKGIKRDLWEGGIKSPMIVWGPGVVQQNVVSDHLGYAGDFMATAADIAQVSLTTPVDSVSFLPTLKGDVDEQQSNKYLYWEDYFAKGGQAARKGHWKAIRKPIHTGNIVLHDLSIDPHETINLASQYPELVKEFSEIFDKEHTPDPDWAVKTKKRK